MSQRFTCFSYLKVILNPNEFYMLTLKTVINYKIGIIIYYDDDNVPKEFNCMYFTSNSLGKNSLAVV